MLKQDIHFQWRNTFWALSENEKEIVNIPSIHNGMNYPMRGKKHNISLCSKMNQIWLNNPQKQVFEKSNKSHLLGLPLPSTLSNKKYRTMSYRKMGQGATLLFWSPMFLIYVKENGSTHRSLSISCSAMGNLTKAPKTWASSAPSTWAPTQPSPWRIPASTKALLVGEIRSPLLNETINPSLFSSPQVSI